MTGASKCASQPSGESARVKITNFQRGDFFGGGWSHSVCNTVYYKTMWFSTTKTQFVSVSYSEADTNNNYP